MQQIDHRDAGQDLAGSLAQDRGLETTSHRSTPPPPRYTLRRLATRILRLTDEVNDLNRQLTTLLTRHTPALLARVGVGPDTAAALLIAADDNPRRRPPGQRSSPPHRHHPAALRPRTRAYQQRRLAEGKTPREIIRCLKRYIAREIYNAISRPHLPATQGS